MSKENIVLFPPGGKIHAAEINHEIASLEAFIQTAPVVVECANQSIDVVELLISAKSFGYQFIDISGCTAVVDCHGHRYQIHSQALEIPDIAIAVCRALISETHSNGARVDWMDARRRLQEKTNSIHSLESNCNATEL